MVLGVKHYRDDYEIEQAMFSYPSSEAIESNIPKEAHRLYENSKLIDALIQNVIILEKKIHELEKNQEALKVQSLLYQNDISRRELEDIFKISSNEKFDPSVLEGMLSEYNDSEDSVEWVRSVRDES